MKVEDSWTGEQFSHGPDAVLYDPRWMLMRQDFVWTDPTKCVAALAVLKVYTTITGGEPDKVNRLYRVCRLLNSLNVWNTNSIGIRTFPVQCRMWIEEHRAIYNAQSTTPTYWNWGIVKRVLLPGIPPKRLQNLVLKRQYAEDTPKGYFQSILKEHLWKVSSSQQL